MREKNLAWENRLICLVVGSRSVTDYCYVERWLDYILQNNPNVVIVSGGAAGADKCAKDYARVKQLDYVEFPADWSKGKSAGYIRNEEMHQYIAQYPYRYVVAFWDGKSKGTTHSFQLAEKYNNPLQIVRTDQ